MLRRLCIPSDLQSAIRNLPLCISLALLAACTPATPPSPTSTPTPTLTPSPTPIPSPTPSATPIPPLALTIRWPEQVSALRPVPIEVELVPPPGVSVTATVRATVVDSASQLYQLFDLTLQEGNLYAAEEPLQLPLEPLEGDWRLMVHVRSALKVEGKRALTFQPAPIPFRDLTDDLPAGAEVHVPQDFVEVVSEGDQVAGGRVWRYGGGEVALWWAPGPVEPLLLNNAVVMLETTYDPGATVQVLDVEETEWGEQVAFLFHEDWPGTDGGPAETLVVQGPDYWLYVLRVRAMGSETIPPLLRQVWGTFTFVR
ncbi:MAG: hypothetical protein ACE5OS_11555 [Anaerolineae bacterium]